MRTENIGGTEASFPVLFARVVTGTIKSARGAGGCLGDDAKNVACNVPVVDPLRSVNLVEKDIVTNWHIVRQARFPTDCLVGG